MYLQEHFRNPSKWKDVLTLKAVCIIELEEVCLLSQNFFQHALCFIDRQRAEFAHKNTSFKEQL